MEPADLVESIKKTGYEEYKIFKLDLDIIIQKINVLCHNFLDALPNIVIAIIIFSLIMLVSRIFRSMINRSSKIPQSVTLVLERISYFSFIGVGFFIALAIIFPSIKPVDLLGGFGIASLAIGFAVKDLLNNFLSGILILLQQPFRVGDEIKHKDLEGVVEDIHIRYTIISGYDGRKFLIPNGEIYSNTIVVNTTSQCRMTYFEIQVCLKNNIEEVCHTLLSAIQKVEGVLSEPQAKVTLTNMTSSSATLKCAWATKPYKSDISKVKNRVLHEIKDVLDGEQIVLPTSIDLFTLQALTPIGPEFADQKKSN